MTETEAKKRWCPMIQTAAMGSNRCAASNCMAWRWELVEANTGGIEIRRVMTKDGVRKPSGFCGLAGEPARR